VVRDLGSANGIIYKGNPVRNTPIQSGDVFVIGETTLEFVTSDHPTMMLVAPPKTIQQVNAEQSAFEKQRERLRNVSTSFAGSALKKPKVLLGVVGVAALFLFFGLDESGSKNTKTSTAKTTDESRDLASYLPDGGGSAVAKEADMFFRAGFREYRTGNYLRAKSNFETVLQMSPNHRLARLYVENSDKAIEGAVKGHLARGKRSMTGGKLKDAKGQFEAVLRLLYRDQSNPNYVQAKEQIEKVDKMMKEVSE
jgi:hypothetical protein